MLAAARSDQQLAFEQPLQHAAGSRAFMTELP